MRGEAPAAISIAVSSVLRNTGWNPSGHRHCQHRVLRGFALRRRGSSSRAHDLARRTTSRYGLVSSNLTNVTRRSSGVPPGSNAPTCLSNAKSEYPASVIVGISGQSGDRVLEEPADPDGLGVRAFPHSAQCSVQTGTVMQSQNELHLREFCYRKGDFR